MSAAEQFSRAQSQLSVWREAPSLNGARTAALGAFACVDAESGARLLMETANLLSGEGFGALLGPMDGDTWGAHRLVVESDGRAPFFLEPRNPPHYMEAFERAGFAPLAHYVSTALRCDELAEGAAFQLPGLSVRAFDRAHAEDDLRRMHALSLEVFAHNAFYRPISAARFVATYLPIVDLLDPALTLLAEDEVGALIGYLFGVPNHGEGQGPRTAILKTYASTRKGLGGALAREFHQRARAGGYQRVIHALMHGDNISARHSEKLGGRVFRRYALFGRVL